jgi:hypothetical protein
MPVMICTTTSGAKYSVRPNRQTKYGSEKMISMATRKISEVLTSRSLMALL